MSKAPTPKLVGTCGPIALETVSCAVAMEPGYGSAILRAGSRLVVGGERGELALYGESWLGLSQIAVLHRGREAITAIAWHVEFIAWSSQDGTVRVYDSERNRGLCAVQPPGTSERMPVSAPLNEQRSLNRPVDAILMDTQLHWTKDDHLCISWRFMSSNEAATATSIDTSACIAIRLLSFQTYRQSASSDAQVQTLWSCCEPLWRNGYKRTWAVPCQWDGLHVLLFACQMGSDDTTAHGTRPASKDCVASSRVTSNSSEHETLLMSLELYGSRTSGA
ncbi:hypothetical protein F1559_003498 [Cyanidiococcus yangmingshanensis]|uniref:Vps41 beta-propeller domain-containing protein n=1 Tax=Cyanidiococcus yangmingshanensis TaxID=2690220 RepID=A0A7J7IGE2_9RHOD|nr:hypothetical protein F1559_003498 [Cyanidiococcus yangmingshanensis]